jgi:hypothetical protein
VKSLIDPYGCIHGEVMCVHAIYINHICSRLLFTIQQHAMGILSEPEYWYFSSSLRAVLSAFCRSEIFTGQTRSTRGSGTLHTTPPPSEEPGVPEGTLKTEPPLTVGLHSSRRELTGSGEYGPSGPRWPMGLTRGI